jgi:hypothetical protein
VGSWEMISAVAVSPGTGLTAGIWAEASSP